MGLVSSLFALGSTTLVASVVPVGDATTRPLMAAFHGALASGVRPAEALARAQERPVTGFECLSATGFVCFGAG